MRIQPASFLVGLGAAFALPLLSRVIRPLAVEAVAASMGFFEEARRVIAEQLEVMEDIAAEARARREQVLAAAETNGALDTNGGEPTADEEPARARPRRRANGAVRRQA
jgi:hypothetical protein